MIELPEVNLNDLSEKSLLLRIAQELGSIRKLMVQVTQIARDAEREVPEFMRRFANYMHDVHDIKYMYEEHGIPVPEHVMSEIRRVDDRYRQLLDALNSGGAAFEKIRREMAADDKNRWEHTKMLEQYKPNGEDNEAGNRT